MFGLTSLMGGGGGGGGTSLQGGDAKSGNETKNTSGGSGSKAKTVYGGVNYGTQSASTSASGESSVPKWVWPVVIAIAAVFGFLAVKK